MIFEGYSLEKKSTIGMRFKKEIYLNDGLSYTLVNPFCRSTCSPIRHLRICIVNSHDDKYKKKPNVHVIQVKIFILKPLKSILRRFREHNALFFYSFVML